MGYFWGLFNMFSGGALERMSILALGIMPYISAYYCAVDVDRGAFVRSIEEKKASKVSVRLINIRVTAPFTPALVQGIGMCAGLISQGITLTSGLAFYIPALTSLVAGTMFLMWLGRANY